MKILNKKLTYSKPGDAYRLYFMGDIHVGSILADKDKLAEDIKEIVDYGPEKAGVILMGDYGEFIGPEDRRYDPQMIDPNVVDIRKADCEMQEIRYLAEMLRPMAEQDQIIAMLGGNHGLQNRATGRYDRWDFVLAATLGLGDQFLGYSGFVRLQFEASRGGASRSVIAHVHHGWQGGRSKGAKINQLEKDLGTYPQADFIVRGHSHNLLATPFTTVGINQRGTGLVHGKKIVGHSGSYLHTLGEEAESYGERAGFRPESPGCLKTWIRFTREGYDIFAGV